MKSKNALIIVLIVGSVIVLGLSAAKWRSREVVPMKEPVAQTEAATPPVKAVSEKPVVQETKPDRFTDFMERGQKDPRGALAEAKKLTGPERESAVKAVLSIACMNDPEFVASELFSAGLSSVSIDHIVSMLMNFWKDPDKALAWAQSSLKDKLQAQAYGIVMHKIAAASPDKASLFFESLPRGESRDQVRYALMAAWGKSDPMAAITYARTLEDKREVSGSMETITMAWAVADPVAAKAYFEANQGDASLTRMGHLLMVKAVNEDPKKAMEWAAALDGEGAERAKRSAMLTWAGKDVKAARDFMEGASSEVRTKMAPALVDSWSRQDPVAASKWVAAMAPGEQTTMVAPLMFHWLKTDADAAAAWLGTLPDGSAKDLGNVLVTDQKNITQKTLKIYSPEYLRLLEQSSRDAEFVPRTADY